jgi:hypothetical protein
VKRRSIPAGWWQQKRDATVRAFGQHIGNAWTKISMPREAARLEKERARVDESGLEE